MTAQGKITAADLTAGTRILVARDESGALVPAKLKTGATETSVTRVRPAGSNVSIFEIETGVGALRPLPGSRVFWRAKSQAKPVETRTAAALAPVAQEVAEVSSTEYVAQLNDRAEEVATFVREQAPEPVPTNLTAGAQVQSRSGRTGTILRLGTTYTNSMAYAEVKWTDGTFGSIRTEFLESVS